MPNIWPEHDFLPNDIEETSRRLSSFDSSNPDAYVPAAEALDLAQGVEDYLKSTPGIKFELETGELTLERKKYLIILKSARIANLLREKYPVSSDSEIKLNSKRAVSLGDKEACIDFSYLHSTMRNDLNEEELIFSTYDPDKEGGITYSYRHGYESDWTIVSPSGRISSLEELGPQSKQVIVDLTMFVLDTLYCEYSEENI